MDLIDCASWFDTTKVSVMDPGAPVDDLLLIPDDLPSFLGQLDVYDDSKRDGIGTERRILSMDPRVALPATLVDNGGAVVFINKQPWLMSLLAQSDTFDTSGADGAPIRSKYVIQRAPAHFVAFDPLSFVNGADPAALGWCGAVWTKETKYESASSGLRSEVGLWMPPLYAVPNGTFVYYRDNTPNYGLGLVRNTYVSSVGLMAWDVIELSRDSTLQSVRYTPYEGFDVVTGRRADNDSSNVDAAVLPFFDDYEMFSHAMVKPAKGDLVVMVTEQACPDLAEGDTFRLQTLKDGVRVTTRVATVVPMDGYFLAYVTQ